jgi:surface antigen
MLLLALAGCGSSRVAPPATEAAAPITRPSFDGPISCVPYARAASGIRLSGDAWQWWDAAGGRYARGSAPRPGSVLVIARTARLPQGHLAVVRRVVNSREVLVDHANWASGAARGRIALDQLVVDVSPRNDWTMVRVWHPPTGQLGVTPFAARGFIHPDMQVASR